MYLETIIAKKREVEGDELNRVNEGQKQQVLCKNSKNSGANHVMWGRDVEFEFQRKKEIECNGNEMFQKYMLCDRQ